MLGFVGVKEPTLLRGVAELEAIAYVPASTATAPGAV
jgi:hypothetical protein